MKIYTNKQLHEKNMMDLIDVIKQMTDLKNMSSDKIKVDNTEQLKKDIQYNNSQIVLVEDLDYNFILDL
jgi:hypothetical protein